MPGSYANAEPAASNIPQIQTTFADVQDDTYPAAEHLAPMDQVRARFRDQGFARHQLQGLNVFLLEMFNRFMEPDTSTPPNYSNDILGVRKSDYMSTLSNDLPNAIANFVQVARQETATIELLQPAITGQTLSADVRITNRAGHRLPSGVGFRRAFIEFVVDGHRHVSIRRPGSRRSSGRRAATNAAGVIVDGQGSAAADRVHRHRSESRTARTSRTSTARARPITQPTQVQIYEELTKDGDGNFTTSFIRRNHDAEGQPAAAEGLDGGRTGSGVARAASSCTRRFPEGDAAKDPSYLDGSGTSLVRYEVPLPRCRKASIPAKLAISATLLLPVDSAVLPDAAVRTGAGRRRRRSGSLYLTSRLDTKGTPIEGWKLPIVSSGVVIPVRP